MGSSNKTEKTENHGPREDQIANAVNFLVHPKVRDSAETSKREFLQKKGLTSEEITEAFARVQHTEGLPTSHVLHASPQAQAKPWGKMLGGVGLLAAGAYIIHKYAVPRINEWRKKSSSHPTVAEDTKSGEESPTLLLANNLKSVETLLMELNCGLQGLSDRIDRLTLRSQSESYHEDFAELKSLIQGSTWPGTNQPTGGNIHPVLAAGEYRAQKGVTPDFPESTIEMGEADATSYMQTLGLSSPPTKNQGLEDANQSNGLHAPSGLPEIEPSNATEDSFILGDRKHADVLAAARAWQPPPLPQPQLPIKSKLDP